MIDLTNAPEGATHYIGRTFYKKFGGVWFFFNGNGWIVSGNSTESINAVCVVIDCDWSVYSNTMPLSELSDEQRGLLFNHWCNGGKIEVYRAADGWVYANYMLHKDSAYRAKQKTERELFIEAAKNSASLRARDGADTVYGEMFDAGFKAPKVGE